MWNSPLDNFERKVVASLNIDKLSGLSSDVEFLRKLDHGLSPLRQSRPAFYQTWFNGVSHGLAAASVGIILLTSLHILPPLLINASLAGTGMIQERIVRMTLDQSVLWQKIAINIEKLK
jgi:hypothetical protein